MKTITLRSTFALTVLFFAVGSQGAAQATPDLAHGSRTEWTIEKLVGFGLIDDRISALRPWSAREASRLLDQARAGLGRLDPEDRSAAERLLELVPDGWLDGPVRADLRTGALELDSPWLRVPQNLGTGGLDASFNPLVRYRGGREYLNGETLSAEVRADARISDLLAVQVEPRIWLGRSIADEDEAGAQLLGASARLQFGDFRIDVGRSSSVWGAGRAGGGLLAYETRGLDRVRISSDTPFRLPGFLSFLGPAQSELFFARLEGDRDVSHSMMVGYTLSVRPFSILEIWWAALIQSLGEEAPQEDFWGRVADHLFLNRFLDIGDESFTSSNKGASMGARLRVPGLRNSQIYAEVTNEDPSGNFRRTFWDGAGWVIGVWAPRLDSNAHFDLRAEFHHGGPIFHRHSQFTSGRSLGGRILGTGGPDTDGGFIELSGSDRRGRISIELGLERRRADRWGPAPSSGSVLLKTEDGPDELYIRGLAGLELFLPGGREVSLRTGVERVRNSGFVEGATRHDGVIELALRWPLFRTRRP